MCVYVYMYMSYDDLGFLLIFILNILKSEDMAWKVDYLKLTSVEQMEWFSSQMDSQKRSTD